MSDTGPTYYETLDNKYSWESGYPHYCYCIISRPTPTSFCWLKDAQFEIGNRDWAFSDMSTPYEKGMKMLQTLVELDKYSESEYKLLIKPHFPYADVESHPIPTYLEKDKFEFRWWSIRTCPEPLCEQPKNFTLLNKSAAGFPTMKDCLAHFKAESDRLKHHYIHHHLCNECCKETPLIELIPVH